MRSKFRLSLKSLYVLSASTFRSFTQSTSQLTAMSPWALSEWAEQAIADAEVEFKDKNKINDPDSNNNTENQFAIYIARNFLTKAAPGFLESSASKDDDRLVKVGRSVTDLVLLAQASDEKDQLMHGLSLVVQQCDILASDWKIPKVRFGKTELQMPIISLGTMRFQQTWGQKIQNIDEIKPKVQANLVAVLKHSICDLGISHVEAARGYGSSEMQVGAALKELFDDGIVKREDLIIQTKVNAMKAEDFRATIEKSFKMLQLDYVDLFSVHGLNMDYHFDLIFNNPSGENLIDIIHEYKAKGKIKHVGFSTHGQPSLIRRCIETEQFEYANVHYHALGSYTASGGGKFGGNKEIVRLMKEKDMGVFIISPTDKGGRLYAPSKKLRSITLPDMEPIQYNSLWLLNHEDLDSESTPIHTIVCGAARPSDLDELTVAAHLHTTNKAEMLQKVRNVEKRLHAAEVQALGEDWVQSWHKGLPNSETDNDPYQFGQMVWMHNVIKSFGMLDFAIDRYGTFDGNLKRWNFEKTPRENIQKMRGSWGYMPGIAYEPGKNYDGYLVKVPEKNKAKVLEALQFTHEFCSANSDKSCVEIPEGWKTAYDMRPWTEFPRQK